MIDRLLVLCNVITTVCSAKGDLNLIDTTISLQLTYYTYSKSIDHTKQRKESGDLQNAPVPSPLHPLRHGQQLRACSRSERPHGAELPLHHFCTLPNPFSRRTVPFSRWQTRLCCCVTCRTPVSSTTVSLDCSLHRSAHAGKPLRKRGISSRHRVRGLQIPGAESAPPGSRNSSLFPRTS